jgi:hypothetical protein
MNFSRLDTARTNVSCTKRTSYGEVQAASTRKSGKAGVQAYRQDSAQKDHTQGKPVYSTGSTCLARLERSSEQFGNCTQLPRL